MIIVIKRHILNEFYCNNLIINVSLNKLNYNIVCSTISFYQEVCQNAIKCLQIKQINYMEPISNVGPINLFHYRDCDGKIINFFFISLADRYNGHLKQLYTYVEYFRMNILLSAF